MSSEDKQPTTYEEAVSLGFAPINDLSAFLMERVGITQESFFIERGRAKGLTNSRLKDCATAPTGSPCFDFCYANGVRILGYCSSTRQCDRFVHGTCEPY